MSGFGQDNPHRISKGRMETMVDTIFAFAMTLLVPRYCHAAFIHESGRH
jgi:hypothetical protein